MEAKEKRHFFSKVPCCGLSLTTVFLFVILVFFLYVLLSSIPIAGKNLSEVIASISKGIIVAIACFFIGKHHPKRFLYTPILCITLWIISAIIEPTFWTTTLWIFIGSAGVLSLIGAISGAMLGSHVILRNNTGRYKAILN